MLAEMFGSSFKGFPKQTSIALHLVKNDNYIFGSSLTLFPNGVSFLLIFSKFSFNYFSSFSSVSSPKYSFFWGTCIVKRHLTLTSSISLLGKSYKYYSK
jgi:hypothetical protein